MSTLKLTVEAIKQMKPLDIVKNDAVRDRFIQVYDTLWGGGEAAYMRESVFFTSLLRDDEKKRNTEPFSIFTAFIDLAVCGLSLEPGTRALAYLQPRNYNIGVGADGKKMYESRLVLTVSGYGELVLRARSGQIRHADNPVLVYEEDEFSFSDKDGRKQVNYTCHLPHTSNHIVACYLRITRADGTVDYGVMLEEDWLRLQGYSERNNRRWDKEKNQYVEVANELYRSREGQIDTGFLKAKCIKHAFNTYPKVRIGKGTELESLQVDDPETDYYEVDEQPAMPKEQPSFAPEKDTSEGVVIDPEDCGAKADGTF